MVKVVARNRRARHDYEILDTYEAGLVLTGAEVKSLRAGRASLTEAYAAPEGEEIFLYNLHISRYDKNTTAPVDTRRPRKLLLHRREIRRIARAVAQKGVTLIALKIYFSKGYAKIEIALARGKRKYDKRETIRELDEAKQSWER
ncbi:MAG: SsrA-binding protein SmpB [Candidatus Coatesbacteria bacterium]|nr:MAG: SsrA-binding protein SmpB [Candidatus Coatesbacteria bacterium]